MIVVICFLYKWRVLRKSETHNSPWGFLITYAEYYRFKSLINNSNTRLYYLKVLLSLIVIFVVQYVYSETIPFCVPTITYLLFLTNQLSIILDIDIFKITCAGHKTCYYANALW